MILIPFEKIELISSLKRESILSRINGSLQNTKIFGNAFHNKSWRDYEGYVDNNQFKFRRILKSGRNSFIPIAKGEVVKTADGCLVKVTIKLHLVVYILLTLITLFAITTFAFSQGWTAILFVVFPYLFCLIFYNLESNMVKGHLQSILKE